MVDLLSCLGGPSESTLQRAESSNELTGLEAAALTCVGLINYLLFIEVSHHTPLVHAS